MTAIYKYGNGATLRKVGADLLAQATTDGDPIFKYLFPLKENKNVKMRWRIEDNIGGLMALRGMGGEPSSVTKVGANVYEATPGYFGEFYPLDEEELLLRTTGIPSDIDVPVTVNDLIAEGMKILATRYVNRLKQMSYTLARTGTLSISLKTGGVGYIASYTPTTVTPATPFTTTGSAVPLREFQKLQETYGRGTSTVFDNRAVALGNSKTLNTILNNTTATDLGGKRVTSNNSVNGLADINRIFLDANVPRLEAWDGGYIDDSGVFQISIPDNRLIIIGARPNGETPGETQLTANANNPGNAPGVYSFVKDFTTGPLKTVPPKIDVHYGFNGGQVIIRPTQIINMVTGA